MNLFSNFLKIAFLSLLFLFSISLDIQASSGSIIINEVQISGKEADNDFIKIYNLTDRRLDVSGFKLKKRSSTGKEYSIKVFPKGSEIQAKGFFFWSNFDYKSSSSSKPDIRSSASLAKNNSIALLDSKGKIIDALSWGESQNPFVEGVSFPQNPVPNQTLERKKADGIYQDTGDNSQDFFLSPETNKEKEAKAILSPEKSFPNTKLADISQPPSSENNFFKTFSRGLFIAVFFGIIMVFLIKKIKKFDLSEKID